MSRRVVVTGMGGICPLGQEWKQVREALRSGRSGVTRIPEWDDVEGLATRLGARVPDFVAPETWPRKKTRSMGRVSLLLTRAAELALEQAGLRGSPELGSGRLGVACGSSSGSPPAIGIYARQLFVGRTTSGIGANDYLQFMSHTTAANLASFFGVRGRVIPTSSACTSGSQGIGYAWEAIRHGHQEIMLAGGGEELDTIDAAVFYVLFAASTRNHEPERTPRPFDKDRDGMVAGEGAACLVLEELEHARARGARLRALVLGYAATADAMHLATPTENAEGVQRCMRLALADAELEPGEVDYLNAHATSTPLGDVAEARAIRAVFGAHLDGVAVSATKSMTGHLLGAAGGLEALLCVRALETGTLPPTTNLDEPDPECELDHVANKARQTTARVALSNSSGFGGTNAALVLGRVE